jgi:predicted transcriptional regulator
MWNIDVLSRARHRAGLTQRELAERAAVPQSTVGRIEAGLVDPRVGTNEVQRIREAARRGAR